MAGRLHIVEIIPALFQHFFALPLRLCAFAVKNEGLENDSR